MIFSLLQKFWFCGVESGRRERGEWADVLWPALTPAMMPDFCLTSFGMVAVVVGLVGGSKERTQ